MYIYIFTYIRIHSILHTPRMAGLFVLNLSTANAPTLFDKGSACCCCLVQGELFMIHSLVAPRQITNSQENKNRFFDNWKIRKQSGARFCTGWHILSVVSRTRATSYWSYSPHLPLSCRSFSAKEPLVTGCIRRKCLGGGGITNAIYTYTYIYTGLHMLCIYKCYNR